MSNKGYILLETVIAGGIVSIALATSVTMIASSRFETSMAARRAEASSLALGLADQLMTQTGSVSQPLTAVAGHKGFRVGFDVTSATGLRTASEPELAADDTLELVRITVEYPSSRGPQTFLYERLRRRVEAP